MREKRNHLEGSVGKCIELTKRGKVDLPGPPIGARKSKEREKGKQIRRKRGLQVSIIKSVDEG